MPGEQDRVSKPNTPAIGGMGFGGRAGFGNAGRWMQGGEKPKDIKEAISTLYGYLKPEWRQLVLVFILVLGSSAISLVIPYLIGRGIDAIELLKPGRSSLSVIVLVPLICTYLTDALLGFSNNFIMAGTSGRIVMSLRRSLFAKFQRLPLSFFDTRSHGEVMSRLTNDVDNISGTISQSTSQLMSSVIAIAGSLTLMILLSPGLTVASLVTVPLVFTLTKSIASRTRLLFRKQQAALGQLNSLAEETLSGLDVVRVFGKEADVIEQFETANQELYSISVKAQILSGYLMPLMNVINNLGFAAVACVGGILAIKGSITVGVIASFLGYSRQFTRPLNDIANTFNALQTAIAGAERVFEVMNENIETDLGSIAIPSSIEGHVELDNVSFGYDPKVPVLMNVSFKAEAGSHIALVGPTGAGKTTVVNLIARFYDATAGSIKIDGIDVNKYTRDSLRSLFGIVLQDAYLFSGSVKENIRYGRLTATDSEVENAAVLANADAFIRRLPRGYDTLLSDGGSNLSQGQRQLISIARVILANPKILILDEATSSVDTRTELNIQEAMLSVMAGRTTFIIAHRLSTIRDADRILVIDGGQIVEEGTHEELLHKAGVYKNMYNSQFTNEAS